MVAPIVVHGRGNPTTSLRQQWGVPCVPHPGADPQHGHQPHNWKKGILETSGAANAPEFFLDGHQSQNWPLDGISMPSNKTSLTSLWSLHREVVKGKMEVEFPPTCGAAQEKQTSCGAAQFDPSRPPWFPCLGCFQPLATTGTIQRTGFSGTPCAVRCTVSDSAFDVHTAGRFVLERALLVALAYVLAVLFAVKDSLRRHVLHSLLWQCPASLCHRDALRLRGPLPFFLISISPSCGLQRIPFPYLSLAPVTGRQQHTSRGSFRLPR